MKKYKLAIMLCYVILAVVLVLDIVFRCHGILGLLFCIVHTVLVLFLTHKLNIEKARIQLKEKSEYESIVEDNKEGE